METLFHFFVTVGIFVSYIYAAEYQNTIKPSFPDDAPPKNPLSRGWNDDIAWITLEDALNSAKANRKPVFVLIHKQWCHACQKLKGTFAKAKAIQELSKHFNMVNCEDDEEPWEEEYQPDGGKYIPRLLFVDPDGEVLKDVKNPKIEFDQYPYYYSNPAPIITAMRQVMNKYSLGAPEDKKAEKKIEEKIEKDEEPKKDMETDMKKDKEEEKFMKKEEKEEKDMKKDKEEKEMSKKDDKEEVPKKSSDDKPSCPHKKQKDKKLEL